MLPNDFVVFWEHSSSQTRYVNRFDGAWTKMVRSQGVWQVVDNVGDNTAARAFHEAESVYALVDRSQPKVEALPPIPSGVYWSKEQGNFYDTVSNIGLGLQFFYTWHHRHAEFPTSNAEFRVKSFPSERQQ